MRTIAISCRKGGCGKTTAAYNIATALAMQGQRVVMVDLDPQASLTIMTKNQPGSIDFDHRGTIALLQGKEPAARCCFQTDAMNATVSQNLFLIPSDYDLGTVEMDMAKDVHGNTMLLSNALRPLDEHFAYCIIDCPTQLEMLVINAWAAADDVILAAKADYISSRAWFSTLNAAQQFQERINPNLKIYGTIPGLYESRLKESQAILSTMRKYGKLLPAIKKSADVTRSNVEGLPVVVSRPRSEPAQAFTEIAQELIMDT